MNEIYEHKNELTFIGYHTEIAPDEGYQKCPEFWDKEYAAKYARLFKTMKPETPVEEAILVNGIGMYAICPIVIWDLHTGLRDFTKAEMCRRDWSFSPSRKAIGRFSRQKVRFRSLCRR